MTYAQTVMRAVKREGGAYLRQVIANTPTISDAARVAGVNRTHLYRLMKRHGLTVRERNQGNSQWLALAGKAR